MSDEGTYYHTDPKKQKINNLVTFYITRLFSFGLLSFVLISIYQIFSNLIILNISIGTVVDFRSDFMEAEGILIKECQEPRVAFKLRNGALFKF